MKKVLSFVLVLCMILGSFGMAFAAPADVVGKDYEDAVNVLVELGVVAGYKDGSFRPENVVTRAEAATFIVKAMGLADYAVGKSEFSDMVGHWADPFVAYAASLGFVKGNTDGTFAPDAPVTSDQMITMLVQAVGYKADYLVGGYPGAFVNQAKALGMLEGVKSGATGCNRGDVAQLIFNTLDVAFVRYSTDGVLQETTVVEGELYDCMLKRLAGKYVAIVEDEMIYGGEESLVDLTQYQGAVVDYYFNVDTEEIIAIKAVDTVFITGEYDDDEEVFVATDKTEYKLKTGVLNAEVPYFENGAYDDETASIGTVEEVTVAVKTSGKYITDVYSIAAWEAAGTIMWNEDDAEALADDVVLGFDEQAALATDDNDEITGVTLVGVEALDKIAEDAIVTYYMGEVEDVDAVVKVEVSTEVVEGKVAKINKDGEYVIGGKAYEAAEEVIIVEENNNLILGAEGKFYLNAAGKIAAFDGESDSADDYAVVTYPMGADNTSLEFGQDEADVKVKLLTADGKEAVYVVDEDATVTGDIVEGAVVAYHINKDGNIDIITAQPEEDADNLSAKNFLDGYKVSADVVVFAFDGEDYTVETLADVPVAEELGDTTYVLKDSEVVVIFLQGEYGDDEKAVFATIVDFNEVLNEDEDSIYEVVMLVDGAKAEYKTVVGVDMTGYEINALYELTFDGSDISELNATGAAVTTTVAAVKDGNIKLEGEANYRDIAAEVVVYLYDEDKDVMSASELSKIGKGDVVSLYELDDDVEGFDLIIFINK